MKALRNLIRAPLRSALLIILMTCLSFVLAVSFLLYGLVQKNIGKKIGPLDGCVKVSSKEGSVRVSAEDAAYIAENFGIIEEYYASSSILCNITNGKNVTPTGSGNNSVGSILAPFTLYAVTETETKREFFSGERAVVDGSGIIRAHHEKNALAIVISDSLAKLNGWKVGDAVNLKVNTAFSSETAGSTFYIAGIYTDRVKTEDTVAFSYQMPENEIYIPLSVYELLLSTIQNEPVVLTELYYKLTDSSSRVVSALQDRLRNTKISGTQTLVLSSFSPEAEAENLVQLSNYINIAIVSSIGCFVVSLLGILIWSFYSRKREMGIYCSLGAKRSKIVRMFFRENGALLFISFLIASILLLGVWFLRGEEIYAFIGSKDIGSIVGTSLETINQLDLMEKMVEQAFSDPLALICYFVLPSIISALLCCGIVLVVVSLASHIWIKKLDVMRVMGGAVQ